jgi:TolB protein
VNGLARFTKPLFRLLRLWIGILILTCGAADAVHAQIWLDLDKPRVGKMPVAVLDFSSAQPGSLQGSQLAGIIKNDLAFTGLFTIVEPSPPIPVNAQGEPDFEGAAQQGVQALITGSFSMTGDQFVVEARLYDVALKKLLVGKRFTSNLATHRLILHTFADYIMEKLDKKPGGFATRIAFVDTSHTRDIFAMDFDGHDLRQMTRTGTLTLSPDWSPDVRHLLFTSYVNRNPDLWGMDIPTLHAYPISARPGLNASGRYSPSGDSIALSLSLKGLPKIFIITPQGNITKRLTDGRGNDISPTWSPDGAFIAYTSDQAGSPQIYMIPVAGGQPKRLTFKGNYNSDPDWSPQGDVIAFTARIEGRFQICTIRTDGTDYRVLTTKGSNEEPAWSPDGRMIAFSGNRDGKKQIYVMDARGEIQVPVSPIPGKSPAWSRNFK